MPAIGDCAADPGESFVQVSASQVFLDDFIHHRSKEPVLLLAMLIITGLKIEIVVMQDLPQGRICWLSWVIDWRDGSHESPSIAAALNTKAEVLERLT